MKQKIFLILIVLASVHMQIQAQNNSKKTKVNSKKSNDNTHRVIDTNDNSKSNDVYYNNAMKLLAKHDSVSAINELSKSIDNNLQNVLSIKKRGVIYLAVGKYKNAIEDFSKALDINSKDAESYFYRASAKVRKEGDTTKVYKMDFINNGSDNAKMWAETKIDKDKDYNEALNDYNNAIENNSKYVEAYLGRGKVNYYLREYLKAIDDFNKVIEYDANNSESYYLRACSNFERKLFEETIIDLDKAITINTKFIDAYLKRGITKYMIEDMNGAIDDYNNVLKINPNDGTAYLNRGNAKTMIDDFYGAISDYNKAIELMPSDIIIYFERGCVKAKLEDYEGTINDFKIFLKADPKNSSVNTALNMLELSSNKIKNYPNDPDGYRWRGDAKNNIKDYKNAIKDFNKALEMNNKFGWAYLGRGIAKYYLKDKDSACEDWKLAYTNGASAAESWLDMYCK